MTFSIRPGEALGLVGESGCGKSTLARTVEDPALRTASAPPPATSWTPSR